MIEEVGRKHITKLMPKLEGYLEKPAVASASHDHIRQAVVVMFGVLARHLDPKDPKIPSIVDKLLLTLDTPSEPVQMAVSDNLPPLIKFIKNKAQDLVNRMFDKLLTTEKFAEQIGAAYGLAGLVKGIGLYCLKSFNIMNRLIESAENKKNANHRIGALFAFETLSRSLGYFFEPYITKFLPLMLVTYGDTSVEVREATEDASSKIMSRLSSHCVKLILPSLLASLEERYD
jgi:hypothetical protein